MKSNEVSFAWDISARKSLRVIRGGVTKVFLSSGYIQQRLHSSDQIVAAVGILHLRMNSVDLTFLFAVLVTVRDYDNDDVGNLVFLRLISVKLICRHVWARSTEGGRWTVSSLGDARQTVDWI